MAASKNTHVLHVTHILNVCVGLMFSISPFTPWEFSTWEATWSAYQWVTQLAGWPERLHVAALCNQWSRGEALAWDSWSGSQQRVTELRSQAPQESKRLAGEERTRTVLAATEANAALPVSTLLKLAGLSLRGKREYLWERIYGFIMYVLHESLAVWKCWCLTLASPPPAPCASIGQLLLGMV